MKLAKSKQLNKKQQPALHLAQVSSSSSSDVEEEEDQRQASNIQMFLQMQTGLKELKNTQAKLHKLSTAGKSKPTIQQLGKIAKSLGIDMNEEMKEKASHLSSNEMIAHTMAERMLA